METISPLDSSFSMVVPGALKGSWPAALFRLRLVSVAAAQGAAEGGLLLLYQVFDVLLSSCQFRKRVPEHANDRLGELVQEGLILPELLLSESRCAPDEPSKDISAPSV